MIREGPRRIRRRSIGCSLTDGRSIRILPDNRNPPVCRPRCRLRPRFLEGTFSGAKRCHSLRLENEKIENFSLSAAN